MAVITDFDRGLDGAIRVDQRPLIDVAVSLEADLAQEREASAQAAREYREPGTAAEGRGR